jgi:hypothetical protein
MKKAARPSEGEEILVTVRRMVTPEEQSCTHLAVATVHKQSCTHPAVATVHEQSCTHPAVATVHESSGIERLRLEIWKLKRRAVWGGADTSYGRRRRANPIYG